MAPILNATEAEIARVMNAIAIIVVYFLMGYYFCLLSLLCFSHCKDKVYFATLQTFSRKIVLDIASRQPNGDKPCYTPSESVVPISKNSQKKRSEHRVGRQSAPSNRIKHPVARQSTPSNRASTLSPVRVLHPIAQAFCRPSEYSIQSHQVSCRPSEYSIQSHQASCRPSECSILSRKHSVARQSIPYIRANTLSPVRAFHTFAQTLCRPSKYSIQSHQASCRPSECYKT